MTLITSYIVSGFRYFTKSKLREIRSMVTKPYDADKINLLRKVSEALNEKQEGGKA